MRNPLIRVFSLGLLILVSSCGDDDPAAPTGGGGSTGLTFTDFQDAAVVIGQAVKTSGAANAGGTVNAVGLSSPFGAGSGAFYQADRLNDRVLGFAGIPTADGAAASFVLGQPDFTSSTSGTTAQNFNSPTDVVVSGGKLFLADSINRRVLIWNTLPTSNDPADVVVGQVDFTSSGAATTQSGFSSPSRIAVAGGKLFVLDVANNRVMIFNTIPTTNGAAASVVVGQTDFVTATAGLTASKFGSSRGLYADGTRLAVGDIINGRVLIWNSIPTTNGVAADVVVGAADFTTAGSGTASATSIGAPWGIASDGTSLFVADAGFHRVLIYDPIPTANGAAATGVLGQGTFTNFAYNDANQDGVNDAGPTARTLWGPTGIRVIGSRLLLADQTNNRVLIFNSQ